ncbi:MAG: hypothetical protein KDC70_00090 [Saprospiraceae bacterium]|nr:hypothetical protein [Saprospiraceae bacterium]
MKPISDLIQTMLSLPSALGFLACVLLVVFSWQALKSSVDALRGFRLALSFLRRRLVRFTPFRVLCVLILAVPVFWSRIWISDRLQYLEQVYAPAYETHDTSAHALAIYEAELSKHCDPYEAEIVKRRTREIAERVGSTPLAIYEVAYSECGLNPFKIRDDGVAAGWIQFTRAGLPGIRTGEKQTTLEQVKAACKRRDVAQMMDWTEQYMVSRAGSVPLPDAAAVYTCVFAPGYVGHPDQKVLYSGFGNPSYYMNKVFDGYYVDNAGRIIRSRAAMDGRITIGEMRLHLEAKKARLLARYKKQ